MASDSVTEATASGGSAKRVGMQAVMASGVERQATDLIPYVWDQYVSRVALSFNFYGDYYDDNQNLPVNLRL